MWDVERFFICKNIPKGFFTLAVLLNRLLVKYMYYFLDPFYCGSVLPSCMLFGAGPLVDV